MAEFDIQKELLDMRGEQRTDHAELTRVVTEGFKKGSDWMHRHELNDQERFNAIDSRLQPIETVKRAAVWLIAAVVTAWIGAAGLIYVEHQSHKVPAAVAVVAP